MRKLNILNGDCAYEEWKKSGLSGDVLVWRENYLHGEIPKTEDLILFNKIRAGVLVHLTQEHTFEEIFNELETMNKTLLSLSYDDKLILWFDKCPFDRAILKRILYLLKVGNIEAEVKLIFEDVVWNSENFLKYCNGGFIIMKSNNSYSIKNLKIRTRRLLRTGSSDGYACRSLKMRAKL